MTIITQAIETKYLKATNVRGSRIKATALAGSLTVGYDYALDGAGNHAAAAQALIARLGWTGTFAQGGNAAGNGYVFVDVQSLIEDRDVWKAEALENLARPNLSPEAAAKAFTDWEASLPTDNQTEGDEA